MGKKEINAIVDGGKATAGPPLGPALGPMGINAGQVVAQINEMTKAFSGMKVPVKVIVDTVSKSFEIEVGTPATSELIKKSAKVEKGHKMAWKEPPIGDLKFSSVVDMAKSTSSKGNSSTIKSRVKEIIGTTVSMGITIDSKKPKDVQKEIDKGEHDSKMV
jgi:large subunit ribosomal protein L11